MALYLGIDIGTSASKGVLIDDRCNIVCQASCGHETDNPCDGWYQHDAEAVWWGDFCRLSRELVMRSGGADRMRGPFRIGLRLCAGRYRVQRAGARDFVWSRCTFEAAD